MHLANLPNSPLVVCRFDAFYNCVPDFLLPFSIRVLSYNLSPSCLWPLPLSILLARVRKMSMYANNIRCTSHRALPLSTTTVGRIWSQEEYTQLEAKLLACWWLWKLRSVCESHSLYTCFLSTFLYLYMLSQVQSTEYPRNFVSWLFHLSMKRSPISAPEKLKTCLSTSKSSVPRVYTNNNLVIWSTF